MIVILRVFPFAQLPFKITRAMESHAPSPARLAIQGNVSVGMQQAARTRQQGLIVMQNAVVANAHRMLMPVQRVYLVSTEVVVMVGRYQDIRI